MNKPVLRLRPVYFVIFGLGLVSSIIYLANFRLGFFIKRWLPLTTDMHIFLFQFLTLYFLYILGLTLIFSKLQQFRSSRGLVIFVFLAAVFFRISLIPTTPILSSDIYRYVWEGRVQWQGKNPYLYAPASEELTSLRDEAIYPHINRKSHTTVYPAGAQIFFFISRAITGDSLHALKGIFVLFDLITMILLIKLLRAYGLEEIRFYIYAWNPLVIYEVAHSGHLEGLVGLLVVLSFYLYVSDRKTASVAALAVASGMKLYPALLLPVLVHRGERLKAVLTFSGCFLALYLPYCWSAGKKIVGFLPIYFGKSYESFNLGLKYFLMHVFPGLDYFFLTKVFFGIILLIALVFFLKEKGKEEAVKYGYIMICLLLVLMPASLHPWYVLWLLPFLAFYPAIGWVFFSGAVAFSYLKYVSPTGIMPPWIRYLEYLPLFALLLGDYFWHQRVSANWFPWRPKAVRVYGKARQI
jgi:hypothetical protein